MSDDVTLEGEEETVEAPAEAMIKVLLQPTTCGVAKFDNGQRLITLTQGPFELSLPLGPGEAEQLSQELHVSPIDTSSVAEAKANGLVLPS